MSLSRREAVLAGLGLLLTGCASRPSARFGRAAGGLSMRWPRPSEPRADPGQTIHAGPAQGPPASVPSGGQIADGQPAGLRVLPRAMWAQGTPIPSKVNPMGYINKVTVHHEGWTPVYFTDEKTSARRIEKIRHNHVDHRGWGDIGYHFIIDRAGRLWQGRPLKYQGAHVKNHNPHNIGVMCLGNFQKQFPSTAQSERLFHTVQTLMSDYRVQLGKVYTHRELNPTLCPGANLQHQMVAVRSNGTLA